MPLQNGEATEGCIPAGTGYEWLEDIVHCSQYPQYPIYRAFTEEEATEGCILAVAG